MPASISRTKPSRRFPNGGWLVRYRDDSNAMLRKTFSTRQDAIDFQAQIHTDKRYGDFVSPRLANTPFAAVATEWLSTKPVILERRLLE
jgi:hypothetical protein